MLASTLFPEHVRSHRRLNPPPTPDALPATKASSRRSSGPEEDEFEYEASRFGQSVGVFGRPLYPQRDDPKPLRYLRCSIDPACGCGDFPFQRSLLDEERGVSSRRTLETMFSSIAGVIHQEEQDRFARMLFRATRGNTFTHFQQPGCRNADGPVFELGPSPAITSIELPRTR